MRSQLVPRLLRYLAKQGRDAGALAARFALPPDALDLDEVSLTLSAVRALGDAAAVAAGDRFIGLHVALELEHGGYGALEFAAKASATLGDAVALLVRHSSALNTATAFSVQRIGDRALLGFRVPGQPACLGRQGNEYSVAGLVGFSRKLGGSEIAPSRLWFAHPRPDDISELEDYFRTRTLDFDASGNGLEVSASILDRALPSADPALARVLEREVLARHSGVADLLHEVRNHLRALLPEACTVGVVARRMNLTARTLQRRLADEGKRFQDLLDEVRHELACEQLRSTGLPLAEIGFNLGYGDLAAFVRAFRRWEGITPAEFRRRG